MQLKPESRSFDIMAPKNTDPLLATSFRPPQTRRLRAMVGI